MAFVVNLLELAPKIEHARVNKWFVKEGDKVQVGTHFVEVETKKAVMEQESFIDGTVLKLLRKEGERRVQVGSPIMIVGDPHEDISELVENIESGRQL